MTSFDQLAFDKAADALFAPDAEHGMSLALVVMQSGDVIAERYGQQPDTVFGPGGPVDASTTLISWSMAKSITHAAVGILVDEGRLQLNEPAPVREWMGTPKAAITLQHLLNMRPGLEFVEDYVDGTVSHCLEMLYGDAERRHGRVCRRSSVAARAGQCVELLQRYDQHRVAHRRANRRWW